MAKKAASAPTTALTKWDEEMAKWAQEAAETTGVVGGNFISIRGGVMTYHKTPVPDNTLDAIVLDHIFENDYYEGKFDSNDPVPPVCFAFGRKVEFMRPHEKSSSPQSKTCATCPHNVFGTADTGAGKACKNTRRLGLVPADAIEKGHDLMGTETAFLKVPVTSCQGWDAHVKSVANTLKKPPAFIVTEIHSMPDPKVQVVVTFRVKEIIEDRAAWPAIKEKMLKVRETIDFPYEPVDDEARERRQAQNKQRKFTGRSVLAAKRK